MNRKITVELLRELGACAEQRTKFAQLFPTGTEVTVELCVKHADVFDWGWAADELLTSDAYDVYEEAMDEVSKTSREARRPIEQAYHETIQPFEDAYQAACDAARATLNAAEGNSSRWYSGTSPARTAYWDAIDAARKDFDQATEPFQTPHREKCAELDREYEKGKAAAWAQAFLSPKNATVEDAPTEDVPAEVVADAE